MLLQFFHHTYVISLQKESDESEEKKTAVPEKKKTAAVLKNKPDHAAPNSSLFEDSVEGLFKPSDSASVRLDIFLIKDSRYGFSIASDDTRPRPKIFRKTCYCL